jgi:hypothetical protein
LPQVNNKSTKLKALIGIQRMRAVLKFRIKTKARAQFYSKSGTKVRKASNMKSEIEA